MIVQKSCTKGRTNLNSSVQHTECQWESAQVRLATVLLPVWNRDRHGGRSIRHGCQWPFIDSCLLSAMNLKPILGIPVIAAWSNRALLRGKKWLAVMFNSSDIYRTWSGAYHFKLLTSYAGLWMSFHISFKFILLDYALFCAHLDSDVQSKEQKHHDFVMRVMWPMANGHGGKNKWIHI